MDPNVHSSQSIRVPGTHVTPPSLEHAHLSKADEATHEMGSKAIPHNEESSSPALGNGKIKPFFTVDGPEWEGIEPPLSQAPKALTGRKLDESFNPNNPPPPTMFGMEFPPSQIVQETTKAPLAPETSVPLQPAVVPEPLASKLETYKADSFKRGNLLTAAAAPVSGFDQIKEKMGAVLAYVENEKAQGKQPSVDTEKLSDNYQKLKRAVDTAESHIKAFGDQQDLTTKYIERTKTTPETTATKTSNVFSRITDTLFSKSVRFFIKRGMSLQRNMMRLFPNEDKLLNSINRTNGLFTTVAADLERARSLVFQINLQINSMEDAIEKDVVTFRQNQQIAMVHAIETEAPSLTNFDHIADIKAGIKTVLKENPIPNQENALTMQFFKDYERDFQLTVHDPSTQERSHNKGDFSSAFSLLQDKTTGFDSDNTWLKTLQAVSSQGMYVHASLLMLPGMNLAGEAALTEQWPDHNEHALTVVVSNNQTMITIDSASSGPPKVIVTNSSTYLIKEEVSKRSNKHDSPPPIEIGTYSRSFELSLSPNGEPIINDVQFVSSFAHPSLLAKGGAEASNA